MDNPVSQDAPGLDLAAPDQTPAPSEAAAQAAASTAATDGAVSTVPPSPKEPRKRRGPPADGAQEDRVTVILTTSRMPGSGGVALRRGQAVSVPVRRLDALIAAGRVRKADEVELARALKKFPQGAIG